MRSVDRKIVIECLDRHAELLTDEQVCCAHYKNYFP